MKNIQDLKQPESQSFQQLQELLINAQKIREADQNTIQKAANQQARQTNRLATLSPQIDQATSRPNDQETKRPIDQ